jgi:hypothetical protein
MGKLFAQIADTGNIIEIDIVITGKPDQNIQRDLRAPCLIVAVSPGRDLDRNSNIFLGKVILVSEFLDSGFTCDTHRNDPFEKASGDALRLRCDVAKPQKNYSIIAVKYVVKRLSQEGDGQVLGQYGDKQ